VFGAVWIGEEAIIDDAMVIEVVENELRSSDAVCFLWFSCIFVGFASCALCSLLLLISVECCLVQN